MKVNKTHLILPLFFFQISLGQITDAKEIFGQIFDKTFLEGVNVVNNNTQHTTVSDENGMFSILVRQGDVLVFSAVNLEPLKHRITAEDMITSNFQIKMQAKEIELKEVIVNENADINAKKLGIVSKDQKSYTPAERKLATAGDFKPKMLLQLLGGSMPLDPLINKINGRTKRLKRDLKTENKENFIKEIGYLFDDNYYIDNLKIPIEHIQGFKFYAAENEEAMTFLKDKKKIELEYLLHDLCLKYKEIITSENK